MAVAALHVISLHIALFHTRSHNLPLLRDHREDDLGEGHLHGTQRQTKEFAQ